MAFLLKVVQGPDVGKSVRLEPGQTYQLGCDDDSSLPLSDPMVLKGHCSIVVERSAIVLRNHTASAGTYVGEKKVSQARLSSNSSFRIGDTTLELTTAPRRQRKPAGPDPLVGKILGGYKMKEVVGEGGMGKVYKATQLSLHRDVALKVLRDKFAKDKSFRDLFVNEARAAAQLVHPNVVQVYDAGSEGDVVFFSMEFIGQGSVEEILQRDSKIAWEDAILMVLEAAHGLAYAESKGIVHRDIKPDNLMLNEDGRIKIADLGLAKRGESEGDQGIIGTPHFIPPEQALGKDVDTRADIYSLGATFFRMVTGKTLFSGKTAKEIVLKHIKEPPPAASSVEKSIPDDLDLVFAKMLAKDPNQRYATAQELISALEEVCAHHGIKGSIIKKGVGKRVLIPLIILLVAAGAFVIYSATKDPEVVISQEEIEARKEAERKAKADRERAAEAKRAAAKANTQTAYGKLELREATLQVRNPLDSVYDDPKEAPALETDWKTLADDYKKFAATDNAQEFGFAPKATARAEDIAKRLSDGQQVQESKRKDIKAQVARTNKVDAAHRAKVADAVQGRRFEEAANLCRVDPFKEIRDWKWKNPINGKEQPVTEFKAIMSVIAKAESYLQQERKDVLGQAKRDWTSVSAKVGEINAESSSKDVTALIDELKQVSENYLDKRPGAKKIPEIRAYVQKAIAERKKLEQMLETRRRENLKADLTLMRNTQRKLVSLVDAAQNFNPNFVMGLEFDRAKSAWSKLLVDEQVRTDVYKAFVKERIAMLSYCEYLFARFQEDLHKDLTAKRNKGPFTSREVEIPDFANPDGRRQRRTLKKVGETPYEIRFSRRLNARYEYTLADAPLDWVYHNVFGHKGQSRWKELDPVTEFSLGAFCFETMQYKQAQAHFEKLAGANGRYRDIAKWLAVRAARERAARDEWEAICKGVQDAKSVEQIAALRNQLNLYSRTHGKTIFFLEVISRSETIPDFYEVGPAVPKAPPPPALPGD